MTEEGSTAHNTRRFGQYEVLGTIGRGGMGVVYRAVDLSLDRVVALKVLHDHLRARPQCVSRLQREARAIAGLNHPNIVQVYAVGEIGGIGYFAMEHIEGRPLSTDLIQGGPMPWQRALYIAGQVADALACAHEAQIVHRDVKPPNIILGEGDHVYVTDFGVAKVLTAETQLTIDASRLGTPSYMSPEHCQNAEVTAASDFYSLGVLIFQMISGRLPHEASSRAELVNKIVGTPPARLRHYVPDVPEGVDRLVAHLLEKRPKDRPANGRVLCDLIERVRGGGTLDEDCRDRVAVMATLRASLEHDARHRTPSGDDGGRRSQRPSSSSGERSSSHAWRLSTRTLLAAGQTWRTVAWALVLWCTLCSVTTATLLARRQAPEFLADEAGASLARWTAAAAAAVFTEPEPGVVLAQLGVPGRVGASAGWIDGANGACLVESAAGAVFCTADPQGRRAGVHLLPAPEGFATPGKIVDFGGSVYRDAPLGGQLILAHDAHRSLVALAPPPRRTTPIRLVDPGQATGAVVAAAHPAGGAIAVVQPDAGNGSQWVVAQQEIGFSGPNGAPRLLTPPGASVSALQYSPDGLRLAYLRESTLGQRELWVVRTDGSETGGVLLGRGNYSIGPNAFSPDGTRLLAVNGAGSGAGELQVYRSAGPGLEAAGTAAEAAWHPSGRSIIATAPDENRLLQLWAVDANPPYRRVPLTRFQQGLAPTCRISPDGAHAMATLVDAATPTLAFVRISPAVP